MCFSPYTGQLVDVRGGGRGGFGGSRVPYGSGAPRNDEWAGGRTPMAAGDSSRTPAWGGSSSRSKSTFAPVHSVKKLTDCLQLLPGPDLQRRRDLVHLAGVLAMPAIERPTVVQLPTAAAQHMAVHP